MGYRIASFNMKNLSFNNARDMDLIAKIILDNQFDIVAMQEVLSEGKALTGIGSNNPTVETKAYERSLLMRLGGASKWGVQWGDPKTSAKNFVNSGNDVRGEGYAFLWRKDRFSLPTNANDKEIRPKIFDNYRVLEIDGQKPLIRNPFYGRFIPNNLPEAEIRLINTHIIFGTASSAELRRKEFEILAGQIYPRISEYRKDFHATSPYTIILGDYNLNLESSGKAPYIQDVICFNGRGRKIPSSEQEYCTIYTVQDQLTTLKADSDGFSNNYDHFSYDTRVRDNIIKTVSAFEIPDDLAENDRTKFTVYREKVSDHIPIIVDIDFR